jgi:antitoxin YefM
MKAAPVGAGASLFGIMRRRNFAILFSFVASTASFVGWPSPGSCAQKVKIGNLQVIAYNTAMKAFYSNLRKNLAAMLADREPVVITCDQGKSLAVPMPLEDFASYEETRYLLRSPANAERLIASVTALDHLQN